MASCNWIHPSCRFILKMFIQVSKTSNVGLIMILQEAQFVGFRPELQLCLIYACFLHYNNIAYTVVTKRPQWSPRLCFIGRFHAYLYVPQRFLACVCRSNLCISVSTASLIFLSGIPLNRAYIHNSSYAVMSSIRASNYTQ